MAAPPEPPQESRSGLERRRCRLSRRNRWFNDLPCGSNAGRPNSCGPGARAFGDSDRRLPRPGKWLAIELQCRGPRSNSFTLTIPMFFKVSGFDHSLRRGKGHSRPSPSAPWQIRQKIDPGAACPNTSRYRQRIFPRSSGRVARIAGRTACCCRSWSRGPPASTTAASSARSAAGFKRRWSERDPLTSDALGWLASELKPPT